MILNGDVIVNNLWYISAVRLKPTMPFGVLCSHEDSLLLKKMHYLALGVLFNPFEGLKINNFSKTQYVRTIEPDSAGLYLQYTITMFLWTDFCDCYSSYPSSAFPPTTSHQALNRSLMFPSVNSRKVTMAF